MTTQKGSALIVVIIFMAALASHFAFTAQVKVTQLRKENIAVIQEQAESYLVALARYQDVYCTTTGNIPQASLFPGFVGATWRPLYGSAAAFEISKMGDIAQFTVAVTFSSSKLAKMVGARKNKNYDVQHIVGSAVVKFSTNKKLKAILSRINFDNSYLSSQTPSGC